MAFIDENLEAIDFHDPVDLVGISMMLTVLFVSYLLMLVAGKVNRLIGSSGASVVSRVMGLILASVATSNTLTGIKLYFGL